MTPTLTSQLLQSLTRPSKADKLMMETNSKGKMLEKKTHNGLHELCHVVCSTFISSILKEYTFNSRSKYTWFSTTYI